MDTIAATLLAHADDDRPAFMHEDGTWSFAEVVAEGRRRAALFEELHDPTRPPHIGVLLENVPDYLFWLVGAALSGAVVVGINSTYRGAQLAQLIEHTDCKMIVTSSDLAALLDGITLSITDDRIVRIDDEGYADRLAPLGTYGGPQREVTPGDLYLLIFTSGSTGMPKAVRCTQGRIARAGAHVAAVTELGPNDVVYAPLLFFHASSLFTGWSSSLHAGVPLATRTRFSASRAIIDLHRYAATMLAYTGKVLNYILAVAESPTATVMVGFSSPAGPTNGCASTARTSLRRQWRRLSAVTPTCVQLRSTPCRTIRSATA